MSTIRLLGVPAIALALTWPATVAATGPLPPAPVRASASTPAGAHTASVDGRGAVRTAVGSHQTAILGSAWNHDNSPIPFARLQLRNVETGRVDATAVSNDAGRFAFQDVHGGSYLVELVSDDGRVRTVGHVFTIAPGETVATFVRIGAKAPWFSGFFSNAAQSVAFSAASQGVTAIAPVMRESSPSTPPPAAGGGS